GGGACRGAAGAGGAGGGAGAGGAGGGLVPGDLGGALVGCAWGFDAPAGNVQAASQAVAAVGAIARAVAAVAALASDGLIALERAIFQRHRTAGPDAAARGVGAGLRSDGVNLIFDYDRASGGTVAPLGSVALHGHAAEGQRAMVVEGAAIGRRARAEGQTALQGHVLQGQRASAGRVEQTKGR